MKKSKLFTILSSIALAAAGAFGIINSKPVQKAEGVSADSSDQWSMIGTPDWSTDTAIPWNASNHFYGVTAWSGRFEKEYSFTASNEFKLRKDKGWDVQIGYGGQTGQGISTYLNNSGGNFSVKTTGTYLLTIHADASTYGDKSYGFAIAKPYHVKVYNGSTELKEYYFEDYTNSGFQINYSSSESEYNTNPEYVLEGLYTNSTLTTKFNSGTTTTNQNLKLYAKFKKAAGRYIVGKGSFSIDDGIYMTHSGQYTGSVTLDYGDEIKIVYYDGTDIQWINDGYEDITPNAAAYHYFGTGASGQYNHNIKCYAAGTYTFYYVADGENFDGIYHISVAYNGSLTAQHLAADLMGVNTSSGSCTDNDKFPAMKSKYNSLSASEQATFRGYASSDILQFQNAYLRYCAWARANGEEPFTGSKSNSGLLLAGISDSTGSIAIIVVISLVSVASIGGFFFIKKRRENI